MESAFINNSMFKSEKLRKCSISGKPIEGWGNNAWPVVSDGTCCDDSNSEYVVPARISNL